MRSLTGLLKIGSALWAASQAYALPNLQLDIVGGAYVGGAEQGTVAASQQFDLVALLDNPVHTGAYYLSVALVGPTAPGVDFGTFVVNGIEYDKDDTAYDIPPFSEIYTGELAPHGIFPTQFIEIPFAFDAGSTVAAYNVQTDAPQAGNTLFAEYFSFDGRYLNSAFKLHFDLYDIATKKKQSGILSGQNFAPFSHDAASGPGGGLEVPDAGSTALLMLLGAAAIGAGRARRHA